MKLQELTIQQKAGMLGVGIWPILLISGDARTIPTLKQL